MLKVDGLTIGWVDTSIRVVVDAGLLSRFASVLITSIDSETSLTETEQGKRIVSFNPACKMFGSALLVPGELVGVIAASLELFHGFDELWCFDRTPPAAKPSDLWIVSPLNLDKDACPPRLLSWMFETDCALGLGDGIGLNYVTSDPHLAQMLEYASAI